VWRTVDDDLRPHVLAGISRAPMQRPNVLHPAVTALQVEPTRSEVPTVQDVVVRALVATQHNLNCNTIRGELQHNREVD